MDPALYAEILALGLASVVGMTTLVIWLFKSAPGWLGRVIEARLTHLEHQLASNTEITKQARDAAQDTGAIQVDRDSLAAQLAAERDAHQATMIARDTFRDIVRYVNATPIGREMLLTYQDRRRMTVHDAAVDAMLLAPTNDSPTPAPTASTTRSDASRVAKDAP
jgi:hypothetical protein